MYQFTFIRGTNKFSFVYHFFEYVSGVSLLRAREWVSLEIQSLSYRSALARNSYRLFQDYFLFQLE
jgi:hypothetical protein